MSWLIMVQAGIDKFEEQGNRGWSLGRSLYGDVVGFLPEIDGAAAFLRPENSFSLLMRPQHLVTKQESGPSGYLGNFQNNHFVPYLQKQQQT